MQDAIALLVQDRCNSLVRLYPTLIHYHGLPITPLADMSRALRGRHGMVSFEHPYQIADAVEVCRSVVLDNGAFSAWRARRAHHFAGYVDWAIKWLRHPAVEWCVIPDVIDGDEQANDRLLASWPLKREAAYRDEAGRSWCGPTA